jgi:hypothetical protein
MFWDLRGRPLGELGVAGDTQSPRTRHARDWTSGSYIQPLRLCCWGVPAASFQCRVTGSSDRLAVACNTLFFAV